MLTLGLEQARRGGRGVGDLQEPATVAWQSPPGVKGQTQDPPRSINIRQKITQWEGLSLQGGSQDDKDHSTPPKSKAAPRGRDSLSQARSQGLDFREAPRGSGARSVAPGRKWDPPQTSTKPPDSTSSTLCLAPPRDDVAKPALSPGTRVFSPYGGVKGGMAAPPAPEDMPPGSFYTSRGFWRRLEGDQLYWERAGRQGSVEALGPPKPQRTFQYQGANGSARHVVQWDDRGDPASQSRSMSNGIGRPNVLAPPPCNNGFSRHKKNRKSFEYEDVVRLTAQQGAEGREVRRSALSHAFSDDNIYEDVIPAVTRDNPYEDVKLSPVTCLPIRRPRPWASVQRQGPRVPTLPPKPQTLLASRGKVERKTPPTTGSPCPPVLPSPPRPPAPPRHTATQRTPRQPQYVSQIQMVFDAKRGRKRVKSQGGPVREENSGTESDPEDGKAGSRRSVYVQSTLKRRPGYHTLERDLIQLQQQQLFQQFVVVSLRKTSPGNAYCPEITQQFPNKLEKASRHNREAEDRLKAIPKFCFPDSLDWRPTADMNSETFSFVLTGEDGSRWFCYCRKILPSGKGTRLPEVHCIVSRLGCFNLFAKILEEVERRRDVSPALVSPFMRSVMEAPFPAPGRTISVKSFLPGSGNEVLTLCRPVDSRLEHVDFESLLQCLSVSRLLQVFASLLLERRVIFIADKLSVLSRCGHAVLALLYPFTWQHTFVPVLPLSMLDISCSPTPFLMGALAPCLPQLLELPIEEVLIVDLCADRFVVQLGDEDCILPSKLQAALLYLLEERESILGLEEQDASSGQQGALSSLLSETFVQFFVELVGHYPFHMSDTAVPGVRELQRDSFRKSHPSRGARQFLQLFMDTQMFAGFIHDKELRKGGGKGLFEVRAAEYLESCPDPEPSGVNRLLKGLGKFLQIK